MPYDVTIEQCITASYVHRMINSVLEQSRLPSSKDALILVKPNLNSDMNALTGNTTDLRIIAGLLNALSNRGYTNIVIADGTSSGFYRNKIDVASRLRIDRVAKRYGAKLVDLNRSVWRQVDFGDDFSAKVAEICLERDYMINLPKLKMHFEMGVSACLKNLIGCLVGLEKQKAHDHLARNILKLNEVIKPDLNIVDGLIVMEGNGPSAGDPAYLGMVVAGSSSYAVDAVCAILLGWDPHEIPYLKLAEELGYLERDYLKSLVLPCSVPGSYRKPKNSLLVSFTYHPRVRRHITRFRLSPLGGKIFSGKIVSDVLLNLGLRQDIFISEDGNVKRVHLNKQACNRCLVCFEYCPMGLDLPDELGTGSERCILCLYCYLVCPSEAIRFDGEEGFLRRQMERYGKLTRLAVKKQLEDVKKSSEGPRHG